MTHNENVETTIITGDEMRQYLDGYLRVLYEAAPGSIGGVLPDEGFYHIPD